MIRVIHITEHIPQQSVGKSIPKIIPMTIQMTTSKILMTILMIQVITNREIIWTKINIKNNRKIKFGFPIINEEI